MDFKSEMRERIKNHNAYIIQQVRAGLFDNDKNEESIEATALFLLALISKRLPEKKELSKEQTCDTCEHKSDSGIEYCGSCDGSTSNWTPNSDIVVNRGFNQCLSEIKKEMGI